MTYPTDVTPDFFFSGLSLQEYIEGMAQNRDLLEANYSNFKLNREELAALASIKDVRYVLVLTEDWCGDAIRYLPALARMAEASGRWEIRIFYRDAHPDLAERWLKHGTRRAIPAIVFYDDDWNEVACFVEKPDPVYQEEADARMVFAAGYPDLPDAALLPSEMSPRTLEIFAPYMRAFRQANTLKWERLFAGEILSRLQSAVTEGAGCW